MEVEAADTRDISLWKLLDTHAIQNLVDSFTNLTGIPTALLDINGKVLVASGWKRICTEFHRKNPLTALRCRESDTLLANRLVEGQEYNVYECKNGLIDIAVPIKIDGVNLGDLFTGQFFFEQPDEERFIKQAEEFGFDTDEYLKALAEVPVFSVETIEKAVAFLSHLTVIIAQMLMDKRRLLQMNKSLGRRVRERTRDLEQAMEIRRKAEQELQYSKRFLESIFNSIQDGICVLDKEMRVIQVNEVMKEWYPQLREKLGQKCYQLFKGRSTPCPQCPGIRTLQCKTIEKEEIPFAMENGLPGTFELYTFPIRDDNEEASGIVVYTRDISARKHAELQAEMEKQFSESLINSLPGIMYSFDQFGNLRRWNKNLETVTGYPAERIAEMNPLDFIAPDERLMVEGVIQQVFTDGKACIEAHLLSMRGQLTPYMLTGYRMAQNGISYLVGVGLDISERFESEKEQEQLIAKLEETLSQVKQLSGFLPICSSCKKIRDDEGYWNQLESYLKKHADVVFSHGICPECVKKLYPGINLKNHQE